MYKRQAIYVIYNIETRSCNHCCRGKAIGATYSECVFVAIVIQHAIPHAGYCRLLSARLYHIFLHYLINNTILEKKALNLKYWV